jgi:hypothetical protein
MQGAGRMRKLKDGQKLIVVSLPNVVDPILSYSNTNNLINGLYPTLKM